MSEDILSNGTGPVLGTYQALSTIAGSQTANDYERPIFRLGSGKPEFVFPSTILVQARTNSCPGAYLLPR